MNENDKKRFARYKPGYVETEKVVINNKNNIGYDDTININTESLVDDVLKNFIVSSNKKITK